MDSSGVVLILFDLPSQIPGFLLTFLHLAQDTIEVSGYLIDPVLIRTYLF